MSSFCFVFCFCFCFVSAVLSSAHTELVDWRLQSSSVVGTNGEQISTLNYDDSSWYNITVPSTTLNGLLQNNVYTDPYYSLNLQDIDSTQFDVPWWYRTEFITNADMINPTVWIKMVN